VLFSSGQAAYPAAVFSIIAAGGVASLASPSSSAFELARQVNAGGGRVLVVSEDFLGVAKEARRSFEREVAICVLASAPDWSLRVVGEEDGELRGRTIMERFKWDVITDTQKLKDSLIMLLYSSGTTGVPKGIYPSFAPSLI